MTTNLSDPPRSPSTERPGRRRWAVIAAAAAAVAIAVPAFLLVGGDGDSTSGDPSAGPSTGTTPEPTTQPRSTAFDLLEAVTDGAPPRTAYLEGRRLVRADGSTVELPRAYDQFALVGDRVVATYDDQGNRVLDVLTAAGDRVDSSPVAVNFALNAAGDLVAWATPQGELFTLWSGGELSWGNQGGPVEVAAVTGEPPCLAGEDDCRIYVNNVDGRPPQSVAPDGSVERVAPGAIGVSDARDDGLAAVQVSSSDLGSCSGVYAGEDEDRFRWKTCENSLFGFSPDGSYLLASDPYLDGLGLGSLTVLDVATGDPVAKFTIRGGFVAQQTWEDDTHPLVVVSGPAGWEILRLGLDGARERAVGPVPAGQDPAYQLLTLPGNR